jgi:hypothetical protein
MELWSTSKPGGLVVINLLVGHPVIKRAFLNYCAPFALLLVCCCTGAQIEANRIKKVGAETLASANTCSDNIFENPKYAPIASKTDLSRPNNITLQMLNDKTSPNKQEIALLYAFHGEMQDCRKIALDGVSKMHPLYMLTLVENYAAADKLWADATAGRLSWGQFNEGRKDLATRWQAKIIQADAQVVSQLQNQHQVEVEQRQRAADALQQWSYQQQALANQQRAINAMNQPRTINCNYFGNTAQCNSF